MQVSGEIRSEEITVSANTCSLGEVLVAVLEMCKLRMILMVWVTIIFGYLLATNFVIVDPILLGATLFFSGVVAGGSFILNQYLEIDVDARMPRTQGRPLPQGVLTPAMALSIGLAMMVVGSVGLQVFSGFLPMILTAFIGVTYVWVYTPLKRVTWLNTTIGAIPGAIPPMVGWAAATGEIGLTAWILFAVMFVWQHPHFFAIGWLYRDDYRLGGIQVLPAIENGYWTGFQTVFFAALLIPLSWTLYLFGITGGVYLVGVTVCGAIFLAQSIQFAREKNRENARYLLFGSLMYLPLFLLLLSLDSKFVV